jgi:hypothetical protein
VTALTSVLDKERLKIYGPGHWKLVISAARSLIAADITGTSDPYVVVKSTSSTGLGKIPEEGRSPHVSSTLNPDFKSESLLFFANDCRSDTNEMDVIYIYVCISI